jgi:hypothetical protein
LVQNIYIKTYEADLILNHLSAPVLPVNKAENFAMIPETFESDEIFGIDLLDFYAVYQHASDNNSTEYCT